MKRIFYLGWIGYQNLGDDLMWELFKEQCSKHLNPTSFSVTPFSPRTSLNQLEQYDTIVLGGGSLLIKKYIDIMYKQAKSNKEIILWGCGCDSQNKDLLNSLQLAKEISPDDVFDLETVNKLEYVIQQAKFVGVRGPYTYNLLRGLNMNMKKIIMSGDPGLLLKPITKSEPQCFLPAEWKNSKIIGLNWGTSNHKIYGGNEDVVEEQLASTCQKLIKRDYKIFIYSVWKNDHNANQRLYHKIGDLRNVILSNKMYHQHELLSLLQKFSLTINFKLHANVISYLADTPFIALGYRLKTFDFAQSLNLEHFVIPTDSKQLEQEILALERQCSLNTINLLKDTQEIRDKYIKRLQTPFLEKSFM